KLRVKHSFLITNFKEVLKSRFIMADSSEKLGRRIVEQLEEEWTDQGKGQHFPNNSDSVDALSELMKVLSQHWASGDKKLIDDLSKQLARGGTFTINPEGATPSGTQEESKPPIINYNITMPPPSNNNNNNNNNGNISYVAFSERKASVETFPMFKGHRPRFPQGNSGVRKEVSGSDEGGV
ncbi:unnamed protein product, partial [Rotaria magnacalcarata]